MSTLNIQSPVEDKVIEKLRAGDRVFISGIIYTARDAAHARLVQAIEAGEEPPFTLDGQTLYYMGPSPAPPGHVIGAAGPTTSGRMDVFTPRLLAAGLKTMIGKGQRSTAVKEAIQQYRAVYLAGLGGAGALLSRTIKKVETVAYPELGPEAVRQLEVVDFPAIVANDMHGGDIYESGPKQYRME